MLDHVQNPQMEIGVKQCLVQRRGLVRLLRFECLILKAWSRPAGVIVFDLHLARLVAVELKMKDVLFWRALSVEGLFVRELYVLGCNRI